MALEFKNAATKEKYEVVSPEQKDVHLHIPAGTVRRSGWAGMLSDITPEAAAKYLDKGGNLIKEKTVKAVVANETPKGEAPASSEVAPAGSNKPTGGK